MNVKILVCCHKDDIRATKTPFFPIHVGKELHPDVELQIQVDNAGDNISNKNNCYCELTGMYWAWKNLKGVDVIGLSHYRRYFDFHNQCKKGRYFTSFNTSRFGSVNLDVPEDILREVHNGKIITPIPRTCRTSLFYDYCFDHNSDDIKALRYIINKTQPDNYKKAFFKVIMQGNKLLHYNMFIMKWEDFDNYCTWLFDVLGKVEESTDITYYNPVQKRIYGYMSERLLLVWLMANNKVTVQKPVIWFSDKKGASESVNNFRFKFRSWAYDLSNWLCQPKSYVEEDMDNPSPYYIKKK